MIGTKRLEEDERLARRLGGLLRTMVRRHLAATAQKQKRDKPEAERNGRDAEDKLGERPGHAATPEQKMIAAERAQGLADGINREGPGQLSGLERFAFIAFGRGKLRNAEIAALLGRCPELCRALNLDKGAPSPGNVKQAVYRARKKLETAP